MGIVKLIGVWQTDVMKTKPVNYQRHRFPSEIISHAVWLYHRFCLSFREVEKLLAERGITVTYETIRQMVPEVWAGLCPQTQKTARPPRRNLAYRRVLSS